VRNITLTYTEFERFNVFNLALFAVTYDPTFVPDRTALRRQLLDARELFAASPEALAAQQTFSQHLSQVLREIEPDLLGVYWPRRGEFNAIHALEKAGPVKSKLALPFALRRPTEMHYRAWSGAPLTATDECGLPASAGITVVPDVVLVPCLGYTRAGFRLGYGAGYFDRWLALHPHVTAIGVAWSAAEMDDKVFQALAHDRPLTLIVTERGLVD